MAFATHILVPTDFSQASELAIGAAVMLATQFGAKMTLVHVHDPDALRPPATLGWSPTQQKTLDEEIRRSIEQGFDDLRKERLASVKDVDTVIIEDSSAARGICDLADRLDVDLLVIATHGRTGLKHLLIGSVAERVVRHAPCPVLTLRSKSAD